MYRHFLAPAPGILHHIGQGHVAHLLDHVHFAQHVFLLRHAQMVNAAAVPQLDIVHVAQPVVGQAHAQAAQRGQHATATVMTDHHDVLHPEVVHRELDHRQGIEV